METVGNLMEQLIDALADGADRLYAEDRKGLNLKIGGVRVNKKSVTIQALPVSSGKPFLELGEVKELLEDVDPEFLVQVSLPKGGSYSVRYVGSTCSGNVYLSPHY